MEENTPAFQSRTAFVIGFFNRLDHYKRLLFKYWWILLLAVGAGVGIQYFILKRAIPSYVSEGRMIVNVKVSIPEANVATEEFDNFLGTQVALMQSDSVKNRVKYRLRSAPGALNPSPVDVQVSLSPKSSIFNLTAVGTDPDYTQAFLKATMEEYINLKKELLANASTATQLRLEEKLKQMAVELKKANEDMLDYQASNSLVYLNPNGKNNAAEYLATLTKRLDEQKSELQLLRTLDLDQNLERLQRMALQKKTADTNSSTNLLTVNADAEPTNATDGNDELSNSVPMNLGEMEGKYLDTKKELIELTSYRDSLLTRGQSRDSQLASMSSNAPEILVLDKAIADKEVDLVVYRKQSEDQLKNRRRTLEVQIQVLQDEVNAKQREAMAANKELTAFEAMKESQRRLQARFDQMEGNVQTLDTDKGIGQQSVAILEDATSAQPVSPEKIKNLIMAALVGLVFGIGLVAFIDRLDDRPKSFAELEKLIDLPILGQFPLIKGKHRRGGVPILQLDDDRFPLIEASHSLRSALFYMGANQTPDKNHPRRIMIASARPNDGKSLVTGSFAVSLAQTGARVLLIDADMRRGELHKHFSVAATPGLAEVLAEECGWSTAVVPTIIPNLHLLPCGNCPRNPGVLFAKTGKFLAEIAGRYDYYLFDTTPVLVADDVLSLAPQVDGLLMVVRANFTSGRIVQAALNLLVARKVNVIGLIFNAVNPKGSDYYYYRHKEYYPDPPKRK